ncbi:hypothetical protein MLD38_022396 [Melastoma candidum]|uniref:Uncharacterized protein n=1 Tax=Melastoma candidum TaxID=119954 RepID=A0ACB9QIA2_9MYRT|nr:hypothetical protein MLD38_022396 [Melastoma candidum]
MAASPSFPRLLRLHLIISKLVLVLVLVFGVGVIPSAVATLNITEALSRYPEFSEFTSLLTTTLSSDLSSLNSFTLLAVPNPNLSSSLSSASPPLSPSSLADVLRFHVLLQYLPPSSLPPSGSLLPTLFQSTGRSSPSLPGSLNISRSPSSTSFSPTSSNSSVTLLRPVLCVPSSLCVFSVSSLFLPFPSDLLSSSDSSSFRPPPPGLNITRALTDGHNFNVAALMIAASGVVSDFESAEGGAGLTLFIPTDSAFSELPSSSLIQSLPADRKAVILKYHALHSYYPLGSLESIVNPVQPTLATESMGAQSFTLNISRVNGSLSIDTGIVQASVTQTVFDENPVAIFGVSNVLLPREFFGKGAAESGEHGAIMATAPPPDDALSPEDSPSTSSPGSREEIRSSGCRLSAKGCSLCMVLMASLSLLASLMN